MKQKPAAHESGILVDNLVTMALQRRSHVRSRLPLFLLAQLGTVCSILTLLSMFAPPCSAPILCGVSALMTLFFCWHSTCGNRMHVTMYFFIAAYLTIFVCKRQMLTAGLLHLMNAVYQSIYMTDWVYFSCDLTIPPVACTTLLLCLVMAPVLWLLSYAVMRYQNFFLSMLVTFPFVEIGFFFGIVPSHLPMIGLFAFWCGMGAVQLAGSGGRKNGGKSGFMRKNGAFYPITDMPFLLTERAGILTAASVLALMLTCALTLKAAGYERPELFKQIRSDVQHKVASLEWADLTDILPGNFPDSAGSDGNAASDVVDLSESDSREFQNISLSRAQFSRRPQGRIYLKFSTYHLYEQNIWSRLPEDIYDDPCFAACGRAGLYPPEFLYYAANLLQSGSLSMELLHPDHLLKSCIPYGFQPGQEVMCGRDEVLSTATQAYTIFGGRDYEELIRSVPYARYGVQTVAGYSGEAALLALTEGKEDERLWLPSFGSTDMMDTAALLSKCSYGDFARAHYLTLPPDPAMETIRDDYADLLDGFDATQASPAETIYELQLLRERLCAQVDYSLKPGKTPPSRDFVSYFLLENRKGYCVHYASAGVLLSRMAGVPARYCEGYMIDPMSVFPDEEGGFTADVLDCNAHAWCEVYIDDFGWVPFEYTFTYFTPPDLSEPLPTDPPAPAPTEAMPVMTEPETVPVYTTPVTPTETTPPATVPAIIPGGTPEEDPPAVDLHLVWSILLAAGIAAAIPLSFCAARSMALRRRMRLLRDPKHAPETAWKWLLAILRECHVRTDAHTMAELTDSAVHACGRMVAEQQLVQAIAAGSKLRYSPHGLSEEEVQLLQRTARRLTRKLYETASPMRKFRLKWLKHYL